jgi:AraC-like DNA-binding protein
MLLRFRAFTGLLSKNFRVILSPMSKKEKIPVHRMDDWLAGVYLKSFSTVKAFGPNYVISEPHRHDFYYCVLLDKGDMELEVDFKRIKLGDHAVFLSYPEQVHRIISTNLEKAWFLAFDPSIIDEQLKNILDQCLSEVMVLTLAPAKSTELSALIGHLDTVYNDPDERFRQSIVHSILTAFIYQVASAYLSKEQLELNKHPSRNVEITRLFKQILRQNFKSMKRPSEYADRINISVSHLNDTVKSVTGFSVTHFIQQEYLREAQRLLHYSDLSVKEIAQSVGLDDAQYFNRLFSKVIGISPGLFRKTSRRKIQFKGY